MPMTKRKILILTANPINLSRLNLDQEVREIKEGLKRSPYRDKFEIVTEWAVRPDDLRRTLLEHQPQIVHFSGHGSGETGLFLNGDDDFPKLVSTESLARLFRLLSDVECVLMNACYSEWQGEVIREHIDYVIGMSDAIGDAGAIKFAVGFYDGLGAGRSIPDAFEWGLVAIDLEGIAETNIPRLLKRKFHENNIEVISIYTALEVPEGAVKIGSLLIFPSPRNHAVIKPFRPKGH